MFKMSQIPIISLKLIPFNLKHFFLNLSRFDLKLAANTRFLNHMVNFLEPFFTHILNEKFVPQISRQF